jgi:hypothetical protein
MNNTLLMMALAEGRRAERKEERPCRHPKAARETTSSDWEWCCACGSLRYSTGYMCNPAGAKHAIGQVWGRWRKPASLGGAK